MSNGKCLPLLLLLFEFLLYFVSGLVPRKVGPGS